MVRAVAAVDEAVDVDMRTRTTWAPSTETCVLRYALGSMSRQLDTKEKKRDGGTGTEAAVNAQATDTVNGKITFLFGKERVCYLANASNTTLAPIPAAAHVAAATGTHVQRTSRGLRCAAAAAGHAHAPLLSAGVWCR